MRTRVKQLVIWIGPFVCALGDVVYGDGDGWWLLASVWALAWLQTFLGVESIRNNSAHGVSDFLSSSLGADAYVGELPPITVPRDQPGAGRTLFEAFDCYELGGGFWGVPIPGGREAGYLFVKKGLTFKIPPWNNLFWNGLLYTYLPAERLMSSMQEGTPGIIRSRDDLPREFVEFLRNKRPKRFKTYSPIYLMYTSRYGYVRTNDFGTEVLALPRTNTEIPLAKVVSAKSAILNMNSRIDQDQSQQIANLTEYAGGRERRLMNIIHQLETALLRRSELNERTSGFGSIRQAVEERLGGQDDAELSR